MSFAERLLARLQATADRHPDRWLPLGALPGPSHLAERELAMAARRGEVQRRDFDGVTAWRMTPLTAPPIHTSAYKD